MAWPNVTDTKIKEFWSVTDSHDLIFKGKGSVDGQGYMWWWREYFVKNPMGRPDLVSMERVRNVLFEDVKWSNSPRFHFYIKDVDSFLF